MNVFEYEGREWTIAQLARRAGVHKNTMYNRLIKKGMSVEDALIEKGARLGPEGGSCASVSISNKKKIKAQQKIKKENAKFAQCGGRCKAK